MRVFKAMLIAFLAVPFSILPAVAAGATTPPDQWTSEYAGGANTSTNSGEQLITPSTAPQLTQAWQFSNGATFVAPAIVNGVVYHVANAGNASIPAQFIALSARTGAQLWSTALPTDVWYYRGQTVAGNIALLPFEGLHARGGITAVDLTTHAVLWSRSRPPSTTDPSDDDGTGGPIAVDSGRVYLDAGNSALSAYDINTGALLWQLDPPDGIRGIAAAGGLLYTGGYVSYPGPGLAAYDGATGKQRWTSPYLYGMPVVTGNYVVVPTAQGVAAVAAGGCGQAVCPRIWSAGITDANPQSILIGGATSSTLFVTATLSDNTARLIRLNTTTGARQWTVNLAEPSGEIPIRAGDTVWVMANANAVIGWSATATTSTHLRKISLPSNSYGTTGGLAAASGSLIVDVWPYTLTAYRVPGT
jgi:outer membrane protein assembly factor BamB